MDGSCKAYGESLLHSKKQVEHERLRLAKTVGRLTNSYKGTYKRRQTHRFCSCIDGPLKAPPLTLFHYMRTRPVVNNCILTPSFTFQPRIRARPFSRACAYPLARALIFHEGLGTRLCKCRILHFAEMRALLTLCSVLYGLCPGVRAGEQQQYLPSQIE